MRRLPLQNDMQSRTSIQVQTVDIGPFWMDSLYGFAMRRAHFIRIPFLLWILNYDLFRLGNFESVRKMRRNPRHMRNANHVLPSPCGGPSVGGQFNLLPMTWESGMPCSRFYYYFFFLSFVIFATVGNLYFIKSASFLFFFLGLQCILHIAFDPLTHREAATQYALPFTLSLNGFIEAISLCILPLMFHWLWVNECNERLKIAVVVDVVAIRHGRDVVSIDVARRSIVLHLFVALMKSPYWGRWDFGVNLIRHRWHWALLFFFFSSSLLLLVISFVFCSLHSVSPEMLALGVFGDGEKHRFDWISLKCVISFIKFNKLPSFGGEHQLDRIATNVKCHMLFTQPRTLFEMNTNETKNKNPETHKFWMFFFPFFFVIPSSVFSPLFVLLPFVVSDGECEANSEYSART